MPPGLLTQLQGAWERVGHARWGIVLPSPEIPFLRRQPPSRVRFLEPACQQVPHIAVAVARRLRQHEQAGAEDGAAVLLIDLGQTMTWTLPVLVFEGDEEGALAVCGFGGR